MTGWWWFAIAHRLPLVAGGVVVASVAVVAAGTWAVGHGRWGSQALLPVAVLGAVLLASIVVAGVDGAVPEVVATTPLRRRRAVLLATVVLTGLAILVLLPLRVHTGLMVGYGGLVRDLVAMVGLALVAAAIAGEAWGWSVPLLAGLGTLFVEGVARSGSIAAFLVRPDGDLGAWGVTVALAAIGAVTLLAARPRLAEEVDA